MTKGPRYERFGWSDRTGLTVTLKDGTMIRDGKKEHELHGLIGKLQNSVDRERASLAAIAGNWETALHILRQHKLL